MKKVLLAVFAAGILTTAFAAGASADEITWEMVIKAGSGGDVSASQKAGSQLLIGTRPTATDGYDAGIIDGSPPPAPAAPGVNVTVYRGGVAGWPQNPPALFTKDKQAPLLAADPGNTKTWLDIDIRPVAGFIDPNIHVWLASAIATNVPPDTVGGKQVVYTLTQTYGGSGTWVWDTAPDKQGPIANAPVKGTFRQFFDITLPTPAEYYRFTFTASNASVIPEPGSMLVLASGLTGLVGLISRRRSA